MIGLFKRLYAGLMQNLGPALGVWECWPGWNGGNRKARWSRRLFAIYDVDDMISLDMPWWTFEPIDRVGRFLKNRPNARVFEYGIGTSTVWLSRGAGEVHDVEHDQKWATALRRHIQDKSNVSLYVVAATARGSYIGASSNKPG